jgi:hypothetical protein
MQSPTLVEIGTKYSVPCVLDRRTSKYVPVILPKHRDGKEACLNDVGTHYHIDKRFTAHADDAIIDENVQEISLQNKECLKLSSTLGEFWPFSIVKLHEMFKDHELKGNHICPHQGVKITNACGTCPGHGLIWDLQTKRLKYKAPFYLRLPLDAGRGIIKNGVCKITVARRLENFNYIRLSLEDATGNQYPNAYYHMPTWDIYSSPSYVIYNVGDTITISDKNCGVKS